MLTIVDVIDGLASGQVVSAAIIRAVLLQDGLDLKTADWLAGHLFREARAVYGARCDYFKDEITGQRSLRIRDPLTGPVDRSDGPQKTGRGIPAKPAQANRTPRPAPRQNSLVRFCFGDLPDDSHRKYPFTSDGVYVFLGEIPNKPGHCVVTVHPTGQVYSGYPTEHFAELPEDET